jgi:hypothetical protein
MGLGPLNVGRTPITRVTLTGAQLRPGLIVTGSQTADQRYPVGRCPVALGTASNVAVFALTH